MTMPEAVTEFVQEYDRKAARPFLTLEAMARETLDRTKRIETRLTSYLVSVGFDTRTQRPLFLDDGSVSIPSMDCSVKDILGVIPADHFDYDEDRVVEVHHKSQHVLCFFLPGKE
jgi:hypothetical protein